MNAMPRFSNASNNLRTDTRNLPTPTPAALAGRGAAVSARRPAPKELASTPEEKRIEYGTITHAEVQFDPKIQRDEQPGLINDIARNWNRSALGVVAVSVRSDGEGNLSYWSLDGQQRMKGTMKAAETEEGRAAGATVDFEFATAFYYDRTQAEEAELFLELNNKVSIGAYDKFKNAVLAGYEDQVEVERVLKSLNIAINQPGGFSAWGMAMRVAKMEDGVEHLRWALKLVQDLWKRPGDPASIYDGKVLEALARMRHRYGVQLSREMLIEKFNRKGATLAYLIGKGRDKARINNARAIPVRRYG